MKQIKVSLENLIILLLYLYLVVDTINGVIIREFAFSFSPIYKIFLLAIMIVFLLKYKIFTPVVIVLIFSLFISFHVFVNIYSSLEMFWIFKFLMIISSFYFFKHLVRCNQFFVVKRLFFVSFFIIAFNMLVGVLGYGYAQYGRGDIGTRGLFYAGNEVGSLLIVTEIFILSNLLINNHMKMYYFISLVLLVLSVLLTSKVAIFGTIIIIFILPLINLAVTQKGLVFKKRSLKAVGLASVMLLALVPYAIYYVLYEMNLIARITFVMNKFDYMTVLFSARNLRVSDIYQFIKNDYSIFNMLFGYGHEKLVFVVGSTVEIDLIDLFMLFGLIGVVIIYGFFIKAFLQNINKDSNIYVYKPYVQFGILFILLISVTSGHVINSGLAGIMIGALMSLSHFRKDVL